jgi:hypothetical protein
LSQQVSTNPAIAASEADTKAGALPIKKPIKFGFSMKKAHK